MRGRIPDEVIDQIKSQVDLVDVVSAYVQLKKSGRNFFGLCPFHSEKTPSFSVSPDKQIFYCFGCGAGGDVIRFIMDIDHLTFLEAVKYLADQTGVLLPETISAEDKENEELASMRRALELTAQLYHHLLLHEQYGIKAREYLMKRQVHIETMKEFQLGYAPPYDAQILFRFLTRRGFHPNVLIKAGLVQSRSNADSRIFDRFCGRLIFPIHDSQGRVIAFGGRSLEERGPKYVNTPETPLFHKSNHLFNLHRARTYIRKKQQAVLFEGFMDVIMAWQEGIHTGIATLGTSLTEEQAKIISRNAQTVFLCFDGDQAGQSAAERGADQLKKSGCTIKITKLPDKLDPDDYIRRYGATAFEQDVLAESMSLTAFKLEKLKENFNLQDEDDRIKYLTQAIDVVSELPLAIEQDHYLRRLADEFHLSLEALKEEQRRARLRKKKKERDIPQNKWNNGKQEVSKRLVMDRRSASLAETSEKHLLSFMLKDPLICKWVEQELGADFQTDQYGALAAHLYRYYQAGSPADVGKFIRYLEETDSTLVATVSELAMLNLPDHASESALKDYVYHIKNAKILADIERKEREQQRLIRAGESIQAAHLGKEIMRLKQKVKRLKGSIN
jgi:DNA primase